MAGEDVGKRIEALEKQNTELKDLVNQLKVELEATEKRLDEIEKAAAGGGAGKPKGEKKEKKKKKGGGDAPAAGGAKADKAAAAREKELKAATKEGGKKAQDIAGMHDMGGMSFFAVTMEQCKGDWELLQCAMDGANKEVDESGDDRKGGAHGLAKCFLSTDDSNHLAMYFHCPKVLHDQLPMMDWVNSMSANIGGSIKEQTDEFLKYEAPQNSEKELFPLKMRDLAINQSFAFLKSKKLMPEEDEDDFDMGEMYEDAGIEW
eukprot:m.92872 g.92872  ORF g.92872 m.92872 type:complete len:262 (+) comp20252_c2_seq1:681-1466(+)